MLSILVGEQQTNKNQLLRCSLYRWGVCPLNDAHEEKYTVTYTLVCSSQPPRRVENNRRLLVEWNFIKFPTSCCFDWFMIDAQPNAKWRKLIGLRHRGLYLFIAALENAAAP